MSRVSRQMDDEFIVGLLGFDLQIGGENLSSKYHLHPRPELLIL